MMVASGGRFRLPDSGRPCVVTGTDSTRPRLPHPEPPYSLASVFRISLHTPRDGTPTKKLLLGTGVKLHTTVTGAPGPGALRRNAMTLMSALPRSSHSKPSGEKSILCNAGSLR